MLPCAASTLKILEWDLEMDPEWDLGNTYRADLSSPNMHTTPELIVLFKVCENPIRACAKMLGFVL